MKGLLGFPPICSVFAWLLHLQWYKAIAPFGVVLPVFAPLTYTASLLFHSPRRDLPFPLPHKFPYFG